MAMVPWRKRNQSELATLPGGMDDWFESFFRGLDRPLSLFGQRAWPAIDIAEKDESVLNLLGVIDEYLGKLEFTCTFEVSGRSSPQEVGKAIHVVRNKIESTIANIGEHLYSFRRYRGKRDVQGKKRRRLKKVHQRTSERWQHGNI